MCADDGAGAADGGAGGPPRGDAADHLSRRAARQPAQGRDRPRPSATTRWSSSRGRPARARRPRSPRCAWSSAAASTGRSATPSRGGWPPGPSPSGSPRSWAAPLGEAVGYKVRFTDVSADDTLVKLMTDGILLAEIARDRQLRRYDTLIIDEAHERSLNIDFMLGYLRQLLPRRPDLKVIITSATIDPERFAAAFGGAPIVEVSGRTYPVEVRYRPVPDEEATRARRSATRSTSWPPTGPATSWCSCPANARSATPRTCWPGGDRLDVLPLYAPAVRRRAAPGVRAPRRISLARRVVLATNVAETSLTVPGIRYVIDPGTARISRYSHRTKVQRLPIEPISQASANQRKGRCGAHLGRHLHPAVLRGGLRVPAGVHRSRDPAHQPGLGHLADGRDRPRRRADVPVHRPARRAQHRRRADPARRAERVQERPDHRPGPQAGPAAGRPADRPDDPRGRPERLRPRGAGHRRGAVHPGSARAARPTPSRRPTTSTAGSPTRTRTSSPT